ncbi:hypothetical protein ACFQ61_08540 [Streptomyces sp. NPDC056500]|uniref:hypothetical protein n=1 Tax=Streptomyces sp. NPDC056500 TaxID=3345840 RepID=UPI00369FD897
MDWTKMSARQRTAAQRVLGKLREDGVSTSVSQVAKNFDQAMAWDRGELSLTSLCKATGWDVPENAAPEPGQVLADAIRETLAGGERPALGSVERISAIAGDLKVVREAWLGLKGELEQALTAAERTPGMVQETLVRAAKAGLSRRLVLEHLGTVDALPLAEEAVKESGISSHPYFSVLLRPGSSGSVEMFFDADYSSITNNRDAQSEWDGYQDEPRDPDHNYAAEVNTLNALIATIRGKGLTVTGDGPEASIVEDLRKHHPAVLRVNKSLKKAGVQADARTSDSR